MTQNGRIQPGQQNKHVERISNMQRENGALRGVKAKFSPQRG